MSVSTPTKRICLRPTGQGVKIGTLRKSVSKLPPVDTTARPATQQDSSGSANTTDHATHGIKGDVRDIVSSVVSAVEKGNTAESGLFQPQELARNTREPIRTAASQTLSSIPVASLEKGVKDYLMQGELRGDSPRTIETRKVFLKNLMWFLNKRQYDSCGLAELNQFFYYLLHGHEEEGGRFGHKHLNRPVRPITRKDYYIALRSFFKWLLEEKVIGENPFDRIPKPRVREEAKEPLAQTHIEALFNAARTSDAPARNIALLAFLLDTGCRVSEVIAIRTRDIDLKARRCDVIGKGQKRRVVFFGENTARLLTTYLEQTCRLGVQGQPEGDLPLFLSGKTTEPLTRSGVRQLITRLKRRAGIRGSCSPHALRRTFAVQMLRNGSNVFTVQALLGHSDLEMTQRYCKLSQLDAEGQHRNCSPMDRLSLGS